MKMHRIKRKRDDKKIFEKYSAFMPRNKVLICFFLLLLFSLFAGTKLIFELSDHHREKKIQKDIIHPVSENELDPLSADIQGMAVYRPHRMIWILSLQFFGIVATMFVFIHYFVKPLKEMAITAKRIADGNLDETIPIRSSDEIGNIGKTINDIAVNLQETLLTVWNHTKHCSVAIDQIHDAISLHPANLISCETMKNLESLKKDMESMRTWVKEFDYYAVRLVERKVFATESDRQKKGIQYSPQLGEGEHHD
jgi:methyl-accepting chemotaxis protein